MRKTKLVCTVGPAVDSEAMLRKLILAGMNAARFNFSHGTHESHLATLEKLKRVRDELGRPIATILDTKGPEIRIKSFETGSIEVKIGDIFTLTTSDVVGDQNRVSVTYVNLHKELDVGARVLIDDGLVELHVMEIKGKDIICSVESAGTLSNNKSINIPNVKILLPSLTEKDRSDIKFAVDNDFDFIAASFVRKASDVEDIRAELHKHGGDAIRIISKIENQEGVNNLDEIVNVSDGIMVARGDLGVEIPAHQVPILQKAMIAKCVHQGKPVITATQMLDSMMRNPRPTRAEVSDVANAVFDGTSCVMLSGETAGGKYPIEAVNTMIDTVMAAEEAINFWGRFQKGNPMSNHSVSDAISHTCCLTAMDLNASAILAASMSGHTARVISRFRPACPIVALTTTEHVRRQLAISWGVHPYLFGSVDSTDRLLALCVECARKEGVVKPGDMVVITAGVPIGERGTTNLIKAQVVGEAI
ncbi:MAG: pyruvate kinase [Oscillospiraceae bacterium]